jgi:hypothetical protein
MFTNALEPVRPALESDQEFLARIGPLPTTLNDARRFPRFYFERRVRAAIHAPRHCRGHEVREAVVRTRDLSRGGINLLHTEQLFPRQRLDLALHGDALQTVEVVWCRRLQANRYVAGCRFVEASA